MSETMSSLPRSAALSPSWREPEIGSEANAAGLPALSHVGLVVSDLSVAADDFRRRWGMEVQDIRQLILQDALYYERPTSIASLRGVVRSGASQIEFIQPLSAPSPYADFLRESRGGGVHHLAYCVPDISAHLRRLRPTRAELALDAVLPDGSARVVYIEGFAHGPVIELIECQQRGAGG